MNRSVPASGTNPASERIVEDLVHLSKHMIPLLEACVRGNAVHCAAMIVAILKSCTRHHSAFSACERCASKVSKGTTPEEQMCACCDGCMIVMSGIRLLLSRHKMLVRAAQDLLAAATQGMLQGTAVLKLAQHVLQHGAVWGVGRTTCHHPQGSLATQQEAGALLFLRLCKAMLSTEAGAAAAVGARAAEAALILAAELHAPQAEQGHQCSIVWRESGQLLSAPHGGGSLELSLIHI